MCVFVSVLLLVAGFCAGLVLAALGQLELDKRAVKDGVIKLDGEIYKLEKIDF